MSVSLKLITGSVETDKQRSCEYQFLDAVIDALSTRPLVAKLPYYPDKTSQRGGGQQ